MQPFLLCGKICDLNDHSTGALYSPDLSEVILCNKLPSCNQAFIGRKDEIKAIASHLSNQSVLFITGMAGIGKAKLPKPMHRRTVKVHQYHLSVLHR